MKRIFLIIFLLPITIAISAQIQQGIVKTKGRMDNNGSIIVGSPISDAYVTVLGTQTVASNKDGKFSVGLKSKEFYLKDVTKEGYVLCDADVISRQYAYSAAPLYIVMETPSQLQEDKLYAERQLRRTLTKQLQEKENEIDSLKNRQRISDEEYRQRLQQIFSDQEENEKLITEMSERYAGIDYDQLDEFNRQITKFILNGELMKADSLIRSKGDLSRRHETLKKHQKQLAEEEADLRKKQTHFERNKVSTQKEMEDLAQDYYSLYEIYKMQHKNDSAAYYLELRASLDTTNVDWQLYYANFIREYLYDINTSKNIVEKLLYNRKEDTTNVLLPHIYNELGTIYAQLHLLEDAIVMYQKALILNLHLFGTNNIYDASIYLNLGNVYYDMGQIDKAIQNHTKAKEILLQHRDENDIELASILNAIGGDYLYLSNYKEASHYLLKSLQIRQEILGTNCQEVALGFHNVGLLYSEMGDFDKALEYYDIALNLYINLIGDRHPKTLAIRQNIAIIEFQKGNYKKALEMNSYILKCRYEILANSDPDIAISYGNIANIYEKLGNYELAYQNHLQSLKILIGLYGENHPYTAMEYANISLTLNLLENYEEAIFYIQKSISIFSSIFGEDNAYTQKASNIKNEIEDKHRTKTNTQ